MSFTLKLAARTLPNGKVIPAKEKTFDNAAKLEQWFFKNTHKRKRRKSSKARQENSDKKQKQAKSE